MRAYYRLLGAVTGLFAGSLSSLGCPHAVTTPPDAAYGAPAPFDGGGSTPCELACAALARAGCPTFSDCPTVLANAERDRLEPLPDGAPLTCAALAAAARPQDLGIPCNP